MSHSRNPPRAAAVVSRMNTSDFFEARRRAEHWIIQTAYEYALASLGFARRSADLVRLAPEEIGRVAEYSRTELLREVEKLGPALLVDARLVTLDSLDRVVRGTSSTIDPVAGSVQVAARAAYSLARACEDALAHPMNITIDEVEGLQEFVTAIAEALETARSSLDEKSTEAQE